ncbi:MAG TPA: integrin alpha, partial [Ignavibacteria bacterium]|nr:integrin alpha [Ignavibacteria bacterium]
MKTLFTVILSALAVLSFTFRNPSSENTSVSNFCEERKTELKCPVYTQSINYEEKRKDNETTSKDIDQGWYQNAVKNIQSDEYKITYSDIYGTYQSPNRKNNIRFIYENNGFTARTRSGSIPEFDVNDKSLTEDEKKYKTIEEWELKMKVDEEKWGLEGSAIQADGNTAFCENEKIKIQYLNNEEGMRQDFIIKQKPAGKEKLRLGLDVETKLRMIVGADALMFKNEKGDEKMKYTALKVWDANGKVLRAYFEDNYELRVTNYELPEAKPKSQIKTNQKSKIKNQKSFAIVVNDEDAVYPITIDPLSTTASWTVTGSQLEDHFGYSAATAGDVNGDGYSDVVIGAP